LVSVGLIISILSKRVANLKTQTLPPEKFPLTKDTILNKPQLIPGIYPKKEDQFGLTRVEIVGWYEQIYHDSGTKYLALVTPTVRGIARLMVDLGPQEYRFSEMSTIFDNNTNSLDTLHTIITRDEFLSKHKEDNIGLVKVELLTALNLPNGQDCQELCSLRKKELEKHQQSNSQFNQPDSIDTSNLLYIGAPLEIYLQPQ